MLGEFYNEYNLQNKICDFNMLVINLIFVYLCVLIIFCLLPRSKEVFVISLFFHFARVFISLFFVFLPYVFVFDIVVSPAKFLLCPFSFHYT